MFDSDPSAGGTDKHSDSEMTKLLEGKTRTAVPDPALLVVENVSICTL
jgi:hypothetical protein